MPFTSKSQARYMFAMHPKMAKEFANKTPSIKALPERAKGAKGMIMKKGLHNGR